MIPRDGERKLAVIENGILVVGTSGTRMTQIHAARKLGTEDDFKKGT